MSNTQTVDVSATNVTDVDSEESMAQELMDSAEALNTAHILGNALLDQLWNAKDSNERAKIIGTADPGALAMATGSACNYLVAKADANDPRLNALPSAIRAKMVKQVETIDRSILLDVCRLLTKLSMRHADEILDSYSDLGPVYAGVPLAVDFGIEAGVRTGSDEDTQRAGIIFGLRLDHFTKVKPQRRIGLSKATR